MKFDLEKSTAKAKFTLEKKGLPSARAQVVTALDVSGSTRNLYSSGKMQEAWQTILPVAAIVDLNKEIDVYTFADGHSIAHVDPVATTENYPDYVKKHILNNPSVPLWGATDYAPVIKAALKDFGFYNKVDTVKETKGFFGFGKSKETTSNTELASKSSKGDPVLCYFFTDGINGDQTETTRLFQMMEDAKTNFYVLFIGVGTANFGYINDLGNRFANVGFVSARDLNSFAGQDDLYDQLIPTEFTEWLSKAR